MENLTGLFDLILRPGTFALATVVVIATFFTRKVVEILKPGWKAVKGGTPDGDHKVVRVKRYTTGAALWWNEVLLYAVPIVYGAALGFYSSDFLHGAANGQLGTRIMWASGVSWFSSFFYKIFQKVILQKTGVDIQPGPISLPPPGAGT